MKVLVTGASGLIGSRLVYRLFHEGHDLVLLGRNPDRLKQEFAIPCQTFAWDPDKGSIPSEALDQIEAVIHLAGEPIAQGRWTQEIKRRIRNSRVHGTRALVDALIQNGSANPSVFICASAIGFYGDRGDQLLDESSSQGKGFLAEVCQAWEQEAKRACEIAPKNRCVELRIGVVLAREGGALAKLTPVFDAGLGGAIGSGKQWMSWIHIEDLVSLIVEALKNEKIQGPINAVAPQPVTNRDFSTTLAKTLHRPKLLPAPGFAVKMALGEMSEAVLSSQRVMPAKALDAGFKFRFATLEDALSDLYPDWYSRGVREFVAHQWVPHPVDKIFPFFADAANLEAITPPWLGFHVLKTSTPEIQEGTLIDYRLSLRGIPLRWKTRIEEWVPNQKFVDTQLRGPYSQWHHTHLFTPVKGGTLLTDRVLYKLPLGKIGALAAGSYVKNDVGKIFQYRKKKIEELYS
ncbi:MAG: TIGR01777 family oxidoreductase [Bdellovibrionia bacterium]